MGFIDNIKSRLRSWRIKRMLKPNIQTPLRYKLAQNVKRLSNEVSEGDFNQEYKDRVKKLAKDFEVAYGGVGKKSRFRPKKRPV